MTSMTIPTRKTGFTIGWAILLFVTAGNVLSHGIMMFLYPDAVIVHLAWAAFNLLAVLILLVPYRSGEPWAWYALWATILVYAATVLLAPQYAVFYLVQTALMSVGQVLAFRPFFARGG
jgi:hypothetical protein